jgi:hypothetical protein
MSKEPISQDKFLWVKEKLDYYRLPTNFPFEATPLLHQLLTLIANSGEIYHNQRPLSNDNIHNNCLDSALKYAMSNLVKENNKLHLDLITAREEIQSLLHSLDKKRVNTTSNQL